MHRHTTAVRKGSANSKKLKVFSTDHKTSRHPRPRVQERTMGPRAIAEYRRHGQEDARIRLENMGTGQRDAVIDLQGLAEDEDFDAGASHVNMEDILDGSERVNISHAGGEMGPWEDEIEEGSDEEGPKGKKRPNAGDGERLYPLLRGARDAGSPARHAATGAANVEEVYEITVVDMFDTSEVDVKLDPRGDGVAPALILEGLVPCAPYKPDVAITVRVLEAFRVLHARAPQLAIQPYVKSLCDLHGVPFRPYLSQQFSIAYDVYLAIRRGTDERVMNALGRDSKWRLKHACPACMYKLEGEDELIFDMLTTMDGNDSLKRVLRRRPSDGEGDGEPTLGRSKERVDNRDAGDGYYLSRERVDAWAKTRLADILPMEAHPSEDNPCADRWKNMVNDVTSKMWGIFDKTGVFLALCRHGFVLVIADMIRSGELAKYPLAIVQELLDVFGMKLGAGYDIGCHFEATMPRRVVPRARAQPPLPAQLSGHICEGMGFEDLEGCERYFSRSNALAKSCRYASRFHRQQEITTYAKHFDSFETYTNLSKFLCTNYRQALTILKTEPALQDWMRQEHVESYDVFHQWLLEEKEYLVGLKHAAKTNVETLEMEYVQKLVNLSASEVKYTVVQEQARRARADDAAYTPGVSTAELARRHAKEKVEKDLESVQTLEALLDVAERWTVESPKWVLTVVEIKKRKYQLALDALELLIVERIFELTKMNQSQTDAEAHRQGPSSQVEGSEERHRHYNTAAGLLDPPMPHLSWEQVVEYAFLADFDILRDTRAEVQSRSWTRPAYRLAMDRYFRILRAREEIKRLNVEIPRVVTWIRDEYKALHRKEQELEVEVGKTEEEVEADRGLALQVRRYRERRGRFDDSHMRRFWALAKEPGFTGSLVPGKALEILAAQREAREAERVARAAAMRDEREREEMEVDSSDEEGGQVRPRARSAMARRAMQVISSDEEEEDEWVFAHNTASSWSRGVDEEMQEGWSDEEGDEELESALSAKLYMLSMLATDGVRGADVDNEG
ncbi:hypothetical protein B0H13DRAFT_2382094 [Mycena leptocephala]|nr:hypothetical protein B0H13DRAFT_2382094 [Mycena leptocephala]